MTLLLNPRLRDPDAVFAALVAAHEGLDEAASRRVDAALVLLLANHIGEDALVLDAIAMARNAGEAAVGWVAARAREQGGPVRVTATDPTGDTVALVVHPDGSSELDPHATGYLDEADPDPAGVHHAAPVRPVEIPTASRFPTPPPARSAVPEPAMQRPPEPAAGPVSFPAGPPPAAGSALAATTPDARGGGRRRSRRTGAPISSAAPTGAAALPAAPLHLSAEQLLPRYTADRIAHASWGWQGWIRRVTAGTIQPRPGAAELTHRGHVRSVQRRLPGPRTIVVVNPKGGAGKTPAALLTAATFGCHRGSALAWDNNETRGTLALRGLEDPGGRTVWDLLADLDRFEDPHARIGDLAAYLQPQGDARFDILASDAQPDRMVEVDGPAFALLASAEVLAEGRRKSAKDRYAYWLEYVVPSSDHSSFRLRGSMSPTDLGGRLEAPAIDLVATARDLGRLDDLLVRVEAAKSADDPARRGKAAMLAVVLAAMGRDAEAGRALDSLSPMLAGVGEDEPEWGQWPELVAASGTLDRPALHARSVAILGVLDQQWRKKFMMEWARIVRAVRTRAVLLAGAGADPKVAGWAPVAHGDYASRGQGLPMPTWTFDAGAWTHHPGHRRDHLFLTSPIVGNFEVECELTSFDWREAQISYGALTVALQWDRKSYQLRHYGRVDSTASIDPPFAEIPPWYAFRLKVKDGTYTAVVQGRTIHETRLPADPDPWLAIATLAEVEGGARNLKITGHPVIPDVLRLSTRPNLSGWRTDYYETDAVLWKKVGDEIVGLKLKDASDGATTGQNPAVGARRLQARKRAQVFPADARRRRHRLRVLPRARPIHGSPRPRSPRVPDRARRREAAPDDRRPARPDGPEARQCRRRGRMSQGARRPAPQARGLEPDQAHADR